MLHSRTPTSHVRFGHVRVDITPPIGIYHRMWGAARHDRATGVHRPLVADVLAFASAEGEARPVLRIFLDLVGLMGGQYAALASTIATAAELPAEHVVIAFSHSHSAGYFVPNRVSMPGGELIPPYLEGLHARLAEAAMQAVAGLRDATITYGTGHCGMGANRDTWDEEYGRYVCGLNPDDPGDDTLIVARVTGTSGEVLATLVNYGCHPTSLAWENTLISPDYPGAMRELVERDTGAPCIFALGACGDMGPRRGFVGDTEIADRNGRELGYAALATLSGMGPAGTELIYDGPVVSGATLGCWSDRPLTEVRAGAVRHFSFVSGPVFAQLKELPTADQLRAEIADWEARQREADASGDPVTARDCGARAERARRWIGRVEDLAEKRVYAIPFSVLRMGDAVWVTCAGEPYSQLQVELRTRFPDHVILVSPLAGPMEIAYLLPQEKYGLGLYQEEPSILAPGCLEQLVSTLSDAVTAHVAPPGVDAERLRMLKLEYTREPVAASEEMERKVGSLRGPEPLTAEAWAAKHGPNTLVFSYRRYTFRDPDLQVWVQEVGAILRDPERLDACMQKHLTPEEYRLARETMETGEAE